MVSSVEVRSQLRVHGGPGDREKTSLLAGRQRSRGGREGAPLPVAWPQLPEIHMDSVDTPIC